MSDTVSLGAKRAFKANDNRLWSPVECLHDAAEDIRSGATPCDRLLVLRLTTKNAKGEDIFNIGYNCAGLKGSEIIALLEVAKAMLLEEMGY